MKKIIIAIVVLFTIVTLTGCGKEKNVTGSLESLMTKVYQNIKEEDLPMMLTNTVVTKDNEEYYLGSADIDFDSALASESAVGSIAHSVVLIRAKDNQDVEQLKKDIKNSVNPRKWICVEVDSSNVIVDSKGNLVILIMDNINAKIIDNNFKNLK